MGTHQIFYNYYHFILFLSGRAFTFFFFFKMNLVILEVLLFCMNLGSASQVPWKHGFCLFNFFWFYNKTYKCMLICFILILLDLLPGSSKFMMLLWMIPIFALQSIFNPPLVIYIDVFVLKYLFRDLQFCSTLISSNVSCTYIF